MTTTTSLQQSPYLRLQRQFPNDNLKELANQSDHAYIDIAQKMNNRTIGLYANNFQIITGESWYLNGSSQRQQTLRQVYPVVAAGSYPHGINFATVTAFTMIYGTFFDGTNYYTLPYVSTVAVADQISVQITPTNIVIVVGAGAPKMKSGFIILEWLSQF